MRSIQRSLTVWLIAAVVSLGLLMATVCYYRLRSALADDFDQSLLAQATALGASVHREPEGTLSVTENADATPGLHVGRFQIRDLSGRTLLRSKAAQGPTSTCRIRRCPCFLDRYAGGRRADATGSNPLSAWPRNGTRPADTTHSTDPATRPGEKNHEPSTSAAAAHPANELTVTLALEQSLEPVHRLERLLLGSLTLAMLGLCVGV